MNRDRHFWIVVAAGTLMGVLGVLLSVWGNPENSGICISCFIENSAGALGLHDNARMQYLRPELIGFVLGSTGSALLFREFHSRGGSAPLLRVFSGIFLIIGCAVFIGCPIKAILRLAAGDWTAVAGVAGLAVGIWGGVKALANGIHLGEPVRGNGSSGQLIPALFLMLLGFLIVRPGFLLFSEQGAASQHAPMLIALTSGAALGALAQRSRFCITGSVRDLFLMGYRSPALWGVAAFLLSAGIANIATGIFRAGFDGQPGAHGEYLWSFLGMAVVGAVSVVIGGCPFRQLIKAGEGDADAGLVIVGMFIGGGIVQSWGLAATAAGVPLYGKIAVLVAAMFVIVAALFFRERNG